MTQQQVVVVRSGSNPLGIISLIFSLIGLGSACFPLFAVSSLLSLLLGIGGLFTRPRGTAIAGVVLSVIGLGFAATSALILTGAAVGVGAAAQSMVDEGKWLEVDTALRQVEAAGGVLDDFREQGQPEEITRPSVAEISSKLDLVDARLDAFERELAEETSDYRREEQRQRIDEARELARQYRDRWLKE